MSEIYIKTTPAFDKAAKKLLDPEAYELLLDSLETHPKRGVVIKGAGGIRKLRWSTGKANKGKSGGVRILYHYTDGLLVLLITLFKKSDKKNISQKEKNQLKALMPALINKYLEDLS